MRALLALVLVLPLVPIRAQVASDPLKSLAPFINDGTYFVARLDVARLNLDALGKRIKNLGAPGDLDGMTALAQLLRTLFLKSGGNDIFAVGNWEHGMDEVLLIVPVAKGGNPKALAGLFAQVPGYLTEARNGVVLMGTQQTLARYQDFLPNAVPELGKALLAAGDGAVHAAVLPPPVLLRSLTEIYPELPKEAGGGKTAPLAAELQWLSVAVELGEKFKVRAVVKMREGKKADLLAGVLDKTLAALANHASLQRALPDFPKVAKSLAPKTAGDRITLTLDDEAVATVVLPLLLKQRDSAQRAQSANNLKQMVLALHNYHDVRKSFPAPASYDPAGKPLLSWRVHLLPFLEQAPLYQEFRLNEPWDSAHNKKLLEKMPPVYRSPDRATAAGKTCYLVPVGPKTIFPGKKGMALNKITDGTSNTIAIVEVDENRSVYWTQPEDLAIDAKDLLDSLLRPERAGFSAAFADGSVRFLLRSITLDDLRALFTASGGEAATIP